MPLNLSDRLLGALLRLFKILAYLVTTVLIFLILAGLLVQTSAMRNLFRTYLVSTISKNLNGTLRVGTIGGSMIGGFTMDSVAVEQDDAEVLWIGRIVCAYEPLALFAKRIDVTRLTLESPRLLLVKSGSGAWNIASIIAPSPDTAAPAAFDWEIRIEDLLVRGGSVTVVDSQASGDPAQAPPGGSFPAAGRFTAGQIGFGGAFRFRGERAALDIESMSWSSAAPEFELQHLEGSVRIEPSLTMVSDLVVQTRNSYVELDASLGRSLLDGVPALAGLRDDPVSLRLASRNVDYTELTRFLTHLPAAPGAASVRCDADGTFGQLTVSLLDIVTASSDVSVRGTLTGLHDPGTLRVDATIDPGYLTMADLAVFIGDIPRDPPPPDLRIGLSGRFTGAPLDFTAEALLEGEFGRIEGEAEMRLVADPPSYTGAFRLRDLNPATLIGGELPDTRLTGTMEIQGADFDPERMQATFFVVLDSSAVRGHDLDGLEATGTIAGGVIEAEARAAAGRSRAEATFSARLSGDTVDVRSADLSVTSIDLAEILRDTLYRSDITARGAVTFRGSSAADFGARAELVLLPSRFRNHDLGADTLLFEVDQSRPEAKSLRLTSSLARVELDGEFDLRLLGGTVADRIAGLADAVAEHVGDTSSGGAAGRGSPPRSDPGGGDMDFRYRVSLNNLLPVGEFLNTTPFNVHGSVEGTFSSDARRLTFAMKGRLEECYIGTIEDGWLMKDADLDVSVAAAGAVPDLGRLEVSVDAGIGEGIVGGKQLDRTRLRLRYADARGTIAASGRFDTVLTLDLAGQARLQPGAFVFDFDTLRARAGDYAWTNDQDVQFRLSGEGLRIMRALFRRGDEELSARGLFGRRGSLDAAVTVRRFDLSTLNLLLPYPELRTPGNGFQGTAQADLRLNGTPESPVFTLRGSSENFVLRRTRLGFIESTFEYADRRLSILIRNTLTGASGAPALTVEGRMPANFSLAGVRERFPDTEQDIRISAADFDVSIFDPLIAELQNLTGTVSSDLVIGGTPRNPAYTGSMRFKALNFLFVPNNLPYVVDGVVEAKGSRLELRDFTLRNPASARPSGSMALSGAITTDRFRLDGFDITFRGDLLVMGEETRRSVPEMYGPLFIRSDSSGINLSGNLARPVLNGRVLVTDAFITFPPATRQQYNPAFRRLNTVMVNDTSAGYTPEEDFLRPFFEARERPAGRGAEGGETTLPFVDALRYNLEVETIGSPAVRFIFSQLSDEILYAELNGRVSVVNDAGETRIYGTIEVEAPSYYKFYQRFDATGRLKFLGPWDNPELDVTAVYEASHVRGDQPAGEDNAEPRRVQVVLEITGRRYEPVLRMTLREESQSGGAFVDISGTSTPAETQSNAISFILTGKFSDELTAGDRSTAGGDASPGTGAVVGSIITSSLTGVLEDYLRSTFPFIRSVDVNYEGGSSPGTNVQVSANALKGYLRVGGKILSDVGRASVSYKASLGDIFEASSIRNLFFEIEQRIEAETQRNRNTVEGRIYYRFSF